MQPRGALYHHVADTLALLDAVLDEVARELVERIATAAAAPRDALAGLQPGCEEWLAAMGEPELQRLYLVEGPAGLGLRRWREIDAEHGGGSLREGIEAVLAERGEPKTAADSLAVLLTGALNEAAVWIAEAEDPHAACRTPHDARRRRTARGPAVRRRDELDSTRGPAESRRDGSPQACDGRNR